MHLLATGAQDYGKEVAASGCCRGNICLRQCGTRLDEGPP